MANSFNGLVTVFANRGIHFAVDETMKFRMQLTKRLMNEYKSQSGWNNAMNRYMMTELEKLNHTLSRITTNESTKTKEELEAEAADTGRTLADTYSGVSLHHDDVLGPVQIPMPLEYDFSGTDVDIPQLTHENCPNDVARNFVRLLDRYITELTRLDERHQAQMITKNGSQMMKTMLDEMYTLCMVKGGEENRSDIPSGVLNRDEPAPLG